ncbi:hypothetical protein SUDANB120_00557 [Streptomyces sp. enrichment culture]
MRHTGASQRFLSRPRAPFRPTGINRCADGSPGALTSGNDDQSIIRRQKRPRSLRGRPLLSVRRPSWARRRGQIATEPGSFGVRWPSTDGRRVRSLHGPVFRRPAAVRGGARQIARGRRLFDVRRPSTAGQPDRTPHGPASSTSDGRQRPGSATKQCVGAVGVAFGGREGRGNGREAPLIAADALFVGGRRPSWAAKRHRNATGPPFAGGRPPEAVAGSEVGRFAAQDGRRRRNGGSVQGAGVLLRPRRRAGARRGPDAEQTAGCIELMRLPARDGRRTLSRGRPCSDLGRSCLRMMLWTSFPCVRASLGSCRHDC